MACNRPVMVSQKARLCHRPRKRRRQWTGLFSWRYREMLGFPDAGFSVIKQDLARMGRSSFELIQSYSFEHIVSAVESLMAKTINDLNG